MPRGTREREDCRLMKSVTRAAPQAALLTVLLAAGLLPASAGRAYTVESAVFVVSVSDGEGNARSVEADLVPYLPNRACFGWRLRLGAAPAVVRYREVLKLPEAPAYWSGEHDAYSPHAYSADRTTATTEQFAAPDAEGWIASSWCIAEGDPVGLHSIDVYIDGEHVRHFDFEVKKLTDRIEN